MMAANIPGSNSPSEKDASTAKHIDRLESGHGQAPSGVEYISEEDNPNVYHKVRPHPGSVTPLTSLQMTWRLFISLVAMSFLWVGSQIPLYLFGSVLPLIYGEIGGADGRYLWMVIGYLIPISALCPFVGALSDLFGRRFVAAFGQVLLIIGPIVVSTAHDINTAIGRRILGFAFFG